MSSIKLRYLLFLFFAGFKRNNPSTYGSYNSFPSNLKNAQDFGLLPADLRQKVNSVATMLNLPVVEGLQKVFVENDAVFHKRCIIKYQPILKVKVEEHPASFVDYFFFCDNGNGTLLSCQSKNLNNHAGECEEYLRDKIAQEIFDRTLQ